jgi:hypothetical protein
VPILEAQVPILEEILKECRLANLRLLEFQRLKAPDREEMTSRG